ncbi:MAG: LD-carboxypeptidase [Deltaproteobacteria bacterium]|nr:LD-carboxypeptidase [Deltaproteobacteria bacterium]
MEYITPPYLDSNSTVSVVSPAGPVNRELLLQGIEKLKSTFKVLSSDSLFANAGYLAGDDDVRLTDFNRAIEAGESGCIIASRGGYGTTRIIDSLNLKALGENPKWIVGSSDLTALLIHLFAKYRLASIHGPMVQSFNKSETDTSLLFDLLKGNINSDSKLNLKTLCQGEASGKMIGGNLTVLSHLAGTMDFDFAKGGVLFLEDVTEAPYRIDRAIVQLKRSGLIDKISAIVLGDFTNCNPGKDGVTVHEVLEMHFKNINKPVVYGYPAAHSDRNRPFIHGAPVSITATSQLGVIKF